jgi:signal transduction histidine kinase
MEDHRRSGRNSRKISIARNPGAAWMPRVFVTGPCLPEVAIPVPRRMINGSMKAFCMSFLAVLAALLQDAGLQARAALQPVLQDADKELREAVSELETCPETPAIQNVAHVGFHSGFAPARDAARWVQVDLGREVAVDSVVVVPACMDGNGAYGFPTRFRIEMSADALMSEPELLTECRVEDPANPLPYRVPAGGKKARYVRFTAEGLVPQPRLDSRFIFCLGELLVFSGGRNVALRGTVLAPNSVETLPTWSPRHLVDGSYALGIPARPRASGSNGWHSSIFRQSENESWVQVDLGTPRLLDEICLIPAHPRDYPDRTGFGFPRRFRLEASVSADFSGAFLVFDGRQGDYEGPGDTRVAFALGGRPVRFIRLTAHRLWERSGDFVFALGELEAFEGSRNVAVNAEVTASDSTLTAAWNPPALVDGVGGVGELQPEESWLAGLARRRVLSARRASLLRERDERASRVKERAVLFSGALALLALAAAGVVVRRSRATRARELEVLRQQISRDLHDEIGSNLCSIRLLAEMSRGTRPEHAPAAALEEICQLAQTGTEALRDMVWLLKEGSRPCIGVLVEKMRSVAGTLLVNMDWSFKSDDAPLEALAPLSFHRDVLFIFREALHNVVKHSGAASVAIEFGWNPDGVRLSIADSGCGFDTARSAPGDGIENMRHRAGQLKGTLVLESRTSGGTRLELKIPTP